MKVRAVLVLSALVASCLSAGASAAPPRCASFTDPAKDDKNADTGTGEDPALDIVRVTESVKGDTFTATMTLADFGDPTYAEGAQYYVGFTVNGKAVSVFGTHSRARDVVDPVFATKGIAIDGVFVSDTEALVAYTERPEIDTVVLSTSLAAISKVVGTRVHGLTATNLDAQVLGTYVALIEPYDEARAPASVRLRLAPCR